MAKFIPTILLFPTFSIPEFCYMCGISLFVDSPTFCSKPNCVSSTLALDEYHACTSSLHLRMREKKIMRLVAKY